MNMKILGLDPSTTSFGYCLIEGTVGREVYWPSKIVPDKKLTKDERYVEIITEVTRIIAKFEPELIIMEYPFNIQGNAKVLVEMFGAIRYFCLRRRIQFIPLAQTRIKKYATGKGGAEKSDMRMQVFREFHMDLSEDEADAFWIAHVGMLYTHPEMQAPKHRHDCVKAMKKKEQKTVKRIKLK